MDAPADHTTRTRQGHGVHLCSRCGWAFPNAHPSARYRRKHKRVCGTVEGYTVVSANSLSHRHSQHSAVSSFSDDENGSDGDSRPPSVKCIQSSSANQGCRGRVLERRNMSADDVFADAVSEFADANASLAGYETASTNASGIQGVTVPVEDVAVSGGMVEASINHENSNESLQEGITGSENQKQVMSLSEIPAQVNNAMTDTSEESKQSNAFEDPDGLETGFKKTYDFSKVNPAPVSVPGSKEAKESSKVVIEEESTSKGYTMAETEISQHDEKHEVKSNSETFMNDHFQESETNVRFGDEISRAKVEGIPQIKFDELSTETVAEGSASVSPVISEVVDVPSITKNDTVVLVNNQAVEPISEAEEHICYNPLVGVKGAIHSAVEVEALETSLAYTGSGCGSNGSNTKYVNSLTCGSTNDDTRAISTTDENGQEGSINGNSNIVVSYGGSDSIGILAEDFVAKVEVSVSENETKSDNLSLNISSEEDMSMSPVLLIHNAGTASEYESLHTSRAVQQSSDVNSPLIDEVIDNPTGISKEVELDDAKASDHTIEMKPVSHGELLQKLEDLSDDKPVESFPATELSSQSHGNNQVDDDISQLQESNADPEKGTAVSVGDAPYEMSSPNGSSLDGNWGSVSVLSTMSDAAGGIKKTKGARERHSDDKHDTFNPPSFLTLIEPEAQKTAATSFTSSEVQNHDSHPDAAKAAWFPSITNVLNDSHGRKKNEEIIAKVTNWSTSQQHPPLKTLLGEAKASSPNSNSSNALTIDKAAVKNGKHTVPTVNSILGSEEADHPKENVDSSGQEWSPHAAGYQDEIKREKRKVKSRPYWVPFMCCSSVSSVK